MIVIRKPEGIYIGRGEIENGTFVGRWHFAFDEYYDAHYVHFGTLRLFNDDTLSPGATWPLHPHREIEVVTYCAAGEFRHADQQGKGDVLKKGWVQHTTVGSGMWHSEINNRNDIPMRFIQMWFLPSERGLAPAMQQKAVAEKDRTDRFLTLVSNVDKKALPLQADAEVKACLLQAGHSVAHAMKAGRGVYFYVLEGGPVELNGQTLPALAAAQVRDEKEALITAQADAELLLIDVKLG